ncbi:contractile injection system protein, VgrG/Pvc8 family [Vibrio sp. PP-XX7]
MGLAFRPDFSLSANGKDISETIRQGLLSLVLTDVSGDASDTLSIRLALPASVQTPKGGAVLTLGLGVQGDLKAKGQFVVNQVGSSGPPRMIDICADAAPMDNRKQQGHLQTQKTRSWHDVTLGNILHTVAGDHGLTPEMSASLKSIRLAHLDQVGESDMNLMTRLAQRYGAISKPANGYWLFTSGGAGQSASGNALAQLTLSPQDVTTWAYRGSSRDTIRRVIATYHDVQTGDVGEVSVGSGEPVNRMIFKCPDRASAFAAAKARMAQMKSRADSMELTLAARVDLLQLVAESHLVLSGFGNEEDGTWRLNTVEWTLNDKECNCVCRLIAKLQILCEC